MQGYLTHIKLLAQRLLIVFAFMTLTRVLFYIMNEQHFAMTFGELLLHLIYGLQFDVVSIAMANLLFIPMSVIPGRILCNRTYQIILKSVFCVANTFIIACNFVDCKFFEWEEKRLTADILTPEWLGSDFWTLLPSIMADYWLLFIGFIASISILIWLYPNYKSQQPCPQTPKKDFAKQSAIAIFTIGLMILCCRGSLQVKPLRIINAAHYTTPNRIPVVLNSSFTIFKTINRHSLPQYKFFSDQEIDSVYSPIHMNGKANNKKNVVIIILESFSKEYSAFLNDTSIGYTPCLDSLMKTSAYCTNAFANGKRSIEALPSIMASIPSLMDNAFITSQYTANDIDGIARILKDEGYYSAFFHGAQNGSMGFDNFTSLAGFDKYYGMSEYNNPSDFDGDWGIFDEPFLQFMANELSTFKQPFLAGVFTLSSHHPYLIPEQYKDRFPKGTLVNHESIGYADYSLGEFFKTASKTDWYNNTIFVLTADHTAQSDSLQQDLKERYAVPLVFFCPSDSSLCGKIDKVAQQCDIMPTILEYVGHQDQYLAFGNNIFDSTNFGFSVSYVNGLYQMIDDSVCLTFDGNDIVESHSVNRTSTAIVNNDNTLSKLKAVIQQYNFRMQQNEMTARHNNCLPY